MPRPASSLDATTNDSDSQNANASDSSDHATREALVQELTRNFSLQEPRSDTLASENQASLSDPGDSLEMVSMNSWGTEFDSDFSDYEETDDEATDDETPYPSSTHLGGPELLSLNTLQSRLAHALGEPIYDLPDDSPPLENQETRRSDTSPLSNEPTTTSAPSLQGASSDYMPFDPSAPPSSPYPGEETGLDSAAPLSPGPSTEGSLPVPQKPFKEKPPVPKKPKLPKSFLINLKNKANPNSDTD